MCVCTKNSCLLPSHILTLVYLNADTISPKHTCASFSVLRIHSSYFFSSLSKSYLYSNITSKPRFRTKTRPTLYFILYMLIIEIISFRFVLFSFIHLFRRFFLFMFSNCWRNIFAGDCLDIFVLCHQYQNRLSVAMFRLLNTNANFH